MSDKKSKRAENAEIVKALSMLSQLGITVMISLALSMFIGYQLDKLFNTGNIFVLIFLFIGMAAAIKSAYTITKGFYSKDLNEEKKKQEYFDDLYRQREDAQKTEKNDDL